MKDINKALHSCRAVPYGGQTGSVSDINIIKKEMLNSYDELYKLYADAINKNFFSLDEEPLKSILIGIMLGDGGIYKSSPTSNARFEMSFGQDYKEFAEFIIIFFKLYLKKNDIGSTNSVTESLKLNLL